MQRQRWSGECTWLISEADRYWTWSVYRSNGDHVGSGTTDDLVTARKRVIEVMTDLVEWPEGWQR